MLDVKPLLEILYKVSEGRVLNCAEVTEEGGLCQVKVPVCHINTGDRNDTALRRFASDWLRLQVKDIGVEARFELFQTGMTWKEDDGREIPIMGALTITWWPRPPLTEYERYRREVRNQPPKTPES